MNKYLILSFFIIFYFINFQINQIEGRGGYSDNCGCATGLTCCPNHFMKEGLNEEKFTIALVFKNNFKLKI